MTDIHVKISFAITVKNEGEYLSQLLTQLVPYCNETGDEIVILSDNTDDEYTLSILTAYEGEAFVSVHYRALNNDFAEHKNALNRFCTGDYIFQIDADETLNANLLKYLHDVLEYNADIDLFLVPRVNIVNGITKEDVEAWRWNINEYGWVMFPDYQTRLYRNNENIKWEGKVHERINGHKSQTSFPAEEEWAIYHIKSIQRQREQNSFYEQLQR
jgi:glycosyltransferase involved in cell wall biosynthesis